MIDSGPMTTGGGNGCEVEDMIILASFWPMNENGFESLLLFAVITFVEIDIMRGTIMIKAAVDLAIKTISCRVRNLGRRRQSQCCVCVYYCCLGIVMLGMNVQQPDICLY